MVEHDYERSIELADRTLGLLRRHRAPATPRNYELFFTYAAGVSAKLRAAFDELAGAGDRLSADDTESLYETYIASERPESKIEVLGGSLSAEIGEVLNLVHSATNSTEAFGESLQRAGAQLSGVTDEEQVKAVLQTLVSATKRMAENSQEMRGRLAESKRQISELQRNLETVRVESHTDPLTGVANRKRFDVAIEQAMVEATRGGQPLCLMMIDIDHFKKFNDDHGHQTGDGVLKLVARTMQANVKGRDVLARYGGEEFAIILGRTPLQASMILAEQIRRAVMGKELVRKSTGQSLGRITLSIGVAAYKPGESTQSLIHRADTCLYAAKHAGRNCVKGESDPAFKRKPLGPCAA